MFNLVLLEPARNRQNWPVWPVHRVDRSGHLKKLKKPEIGPNRALNRPVRTLPYGRVPGTHVFQFKKQKTKKQPCLLIKVKKQIETLNITMQDTSVVAVFKSWKQLMQITFHLERRQCKIRSKKLFPKLCISKNKGMKAWPFHLKKK